MGLQVRKSVTTHYYLESLLSSTYSVIYEHVHKYGGSHLPEEILLQATGEKFNPKYYINYLKEKIF